MNIRQHFLSNVFRSPDDPAVDPPAGDPPAPPAAGDPPAADPPAPPAAAGGDDPPAPPATPEPKAPGWWLTRLAEESEAKRQAEARAARAEEALRARSAPAPAAGDQPPAPAPRAITTDSPEFTEAVARKANEIKLSEDSTSVLTTGLAKFPDFAQSVDLLSKLNVTHDEFVMDLIAADKGNGHLILDNLAKNPETAISLAKMPSRQRIAELVRMSTALAPKAPAAPAPAAPAVSRAPKPAPALAPVGDAGGTDPLDDDNASDEAFSTAWDQKYLKRA